MEIFYFMGAVAVLAPVIVIMIGVRKKYSLGESLLWGLLTLILVVVFGGTQGIWPMLVGGVASILIASRMAPHDQLPKTKENPARPNG